MKKLCLIFVCCVLAFHSYSQNSAFQAYRSGNYIEAIKFYQATLAQKNTLYERDMLALSYLKADSILQAKRELENVVNYNEKNFLSDDLKVQACEKLSGLYFGEKEYKQALYYYKRYMDIFSKARFSDINWARIHFFNANDQAKCFSALGMTDSAIRVLTPYMFYSYRALEQMMFVPEGYRGNSKDSLQHDSISRFYLSLLQKKYTNKQIKADFEKAEQSFTFTENRRPPNQHGTVFEEIKATIDIYNIRVIVLEGGVADKEAELLKEIQKPHYTKAYQFDRFHQLLICRMVRELKT